MYCWFEPGFVTMIIKHVSVHVTKHNVANNWALKVLRVFCVTLLTIHVDLLCYALCPSTGIPHFLFLEKLA